MNNRLYSFFHLNMMFSSIPVEKRKMVINRCYWPLLKIAEKYPFFPGIELTGITLEIIQSLDPQWVHFFKTLLSEKKCDLIGSGYAQIIGPLVPHGLNQKNIELGNQVYQDILGIQPSLAFINEHAFSRGILPLYIEQGFRGIIMEWENAYLANQHWPKQLKYYPQLASGNQDSGLPVIWNSALSFQKLQRLAHGEIQQSEYMAFIESQNISDDAYFPFYGNDAEIFDFRPGRYKTEPEHNEQGEWRKISNIVQLLCTSPAFTFTLPSTILSAKRHTHAWRRIDLCSEHQPVPVKKQVKYNLSRWAVTGINDYQINILCHALYRQLNHVHSTASDWRRLCELWSSDYRTHIEKQRWRDFLHRLEHMCKKYGIQPLTIEDALAISGTGQSKKEKQWHIRRYNNILRIKNNQILLELNTRRGLAIQNLTFPEVHPLPLIGTLTHGFFDDIRYTADYYSGHSVLEIPGWPKDSDLNPATSEYSETETGQFVISAKVPMQACTLLKTITLDPGISRVYISYQWTFESQPLGSLRAGVITLNPDAFDRQSIFYATHNGGFDIERFEIPLKRTIAQDRPVNTLISSSGGIGMTEGVIWMGDNRKSIDIRFAPYAHRPLGLLHFVDIGDKYFFRLSQSLLEIDDTRCQATEKHAATIPLFESDKLNFAFSIGARLEK